MIIFGNTAIANTGTTQIYDGNAQQGIEIKADPANTGTIYVGYGNVTSSAHGFALKASESVFIPESEVSKLYAVASVNNEKLFYMVI